MSISAGAIEAEARLDISQFVKATQQLESTVGQLNKSLENIKPATPRLPTDKLTSDVAQGRAALRGFLGDLGGIPGLSVSASQSLLGVGSGAMGMAVGLGAAAAGAGALALGMKAAADQAIALQFQIAAVKSIKLDLDTKAATASIRDLSITTGQSTEALAKGLYNLFSSIDVSQQQAVKLLEQFSKGAVAAQTDVTTFSTAAIGVLNAYKLSTDDATKVTDIFFNTVKLGVVTGEQLATGLGPLTASAKNAGVSFEELGALIVGVTKEGGNAAENLNNLNNVLVKLFTKETVKGFKDLGINMTDASGKMRPVIEIMTDLQARLKGMTEAAQAATKQELFPDIQARAGASVVLSQLDAVNGALAVNKSNTGSTADAYKTMAETTKVSMERLQNSIKSMVGTFGDALLPALNNTALAGLKVAENMGAAGKAIEQFLNDPKTKAAAAVLRQLNEPAPQEAPKGNRFDEGGPPTKATKLDPGPVGRLLFTPESIEGAQQALDIQSQFDQAFERGNQIIASRTTMLRASDQESAEWVTGTKKAREETLLAAAAIDKLRAGLGFAVGDQRDWNEELAKALDPMKAVKGSREDLIAGILRSKDATEQGADALKLTDKGIAAHALLLQQWAADAVTVEDGIRRQGIATEFLTGHTEASRVSQAAANKANAEAAAEVQAIEAAMKQAARAGVDLYAERLSNLANAVMPHLDEATTVSLKQALLLGDQQKVLAIISAATGQSQEELAAGLHATGEEAAEAAKKAAALAKGFEGFLKDELKSRWSSVLGTLKGGVDAVIASEADLLEHTGHADKALELLLQHAGASPGAVAGLKRSLEEGGAAAFDAREKIAALVAFVRDSAGNVRLKVDVDIENAERALHKLQQDFQEANSKRADAQSKATREFGEQQNATAQAQSQVRADYQDSVAAITRARTESGAQLGRDIASAASAQNAALSKIDASRTAAIADYVSKVQDAQAQLHQAFADAAAQYNTGVKSLMEQATAAIEQAASRQADALRSAGAAMTSAALSTLAALNQQSIAREDLDLRALQGGTQADQNQLAIDRTRLNASQGFQNAQSALALQQARDKLAQEQLQADKDLNKTMQDLTLQMQKLADAQQQAQTKAAIDEAIAVGLAARELEKKDRELSGEAGAAGKTQEQAQSKALEEAQQRAKDLADKAAAEQAKNWAQLQATALERAQDPAGKFRTKAEQAFDEAEQARREEQRKADKAFLEEEKRIKREIENAKNLKKIADGLERPNVNFGAPVIQETAKDLLTKASQVAQQRLKV